MSDTLIEVDQPHYQWWESQNDQDDLECILQCFISLKNILKVVFLGVVNQDLEFQMQKYLKNLKNNHNFDLFLWF